METCPCQAGQAAFRHDAAQLVKELGFDVDLHEFRTSFRTWAHEQTNFPREVAEAARAHVVKSTVEAAYARSDYFERRCTLMASWATYLAKPTK